LFIVVECFDILERLHASHFLTLINLLLKLFYYYVDMFIIHNLLV